MVSTYPSFYASHDSAAVPLAQHVAVQDYARIVIGSDVWIGSRAIVMDGVEVGHGAVIAAGAVVTKDVEPYAVVGGEPARILLHRFPPDVVADLMSIHWWNWLYDLIRERADDFADVGKFVEKYRGLRAAS